MADVPEVVEVVYTGPRMSVWAAAWLYAQVFTSRPDIASQHRTDTVRVLLAWAITVEARTAGLVPASGLLDSPGALARVSVGRVGIRRLSKMTAIMEFIPANLGIPPRPYEVGYAAYRDLFEAVDMDGVRVESLDDLDEPALKRQLDQVEQRWEAARQSAATVVMRAMLELIGDRADDGCLGQFGGWVNGYLSLRAE